MLESLTVKNTAIIDELTVEFGNGMNCLTGETGAGKSIIIDSICCLLGERVSKESIRRGAEQAEVTGIFSIDDERKEKISATLVDLGITPEEDGTIILYRSYNTQGKNVCRINDRIVTLSSLRTLGEDLVDVHGQHDNHSLLSPSTHINLLDLFAGKKLSDTLIMYKEKLYNLKEIENELSEISGDPQKRAQLIDLLNFQVDEITSAKLIPGEEEKLIEKQKLIDNAEKINVGVNTAISAIVGEESYNDNAVGILSLLEKANSSLSVPSKYSENYKDLSSKLSEAYYIIEDVGESLRDELDKTEFDPKEAKKTEERIDEIYNLKRKYGNSIEEIIKFCSEAEQKLRLLETSEERATELLNQKNKVLKELFDLSEILHDERKRAGEILKKGVLKALADMDMSKVKFEISIDFDEEGKKFGSNGLDSVEFIISTNPGEPLKPLCKIASGGELSRIMLAIKSCLADVDNIPVLIFDEIDTGISGQAATSVAEKFMCVSKAHQVICVSHLAQIAAISDHNIFVNKTYGEDFVKTGAKMLNDNEKISEIARLLDGGDITEATKAHSVDLINRMRSKVDK